MFTIVGGSFRQFISSKSEIPNSGTKVVTPAENTSLKFSTVYELSHAD